MIEVWFNKNTREQITIEKSNYDEWYLEIIDGKRCISGLNLYWLMSKGFKKV